MSLHHHALHDGRLLHVGCVCCQPEDPRCGALEHAHASTVAFPLRGVFVKHHAHGPDVVAHPGQALFFNAGEAYRVSHPAGGDDCLVLRADDAVLREILACHDAPRAEREHDLFRTTHAPLPAPIALQRSLLWRGLRQQSASTLEVETRGLALLGAVLGTVAPDGSSGRISRKPARRTRRWEQARAVAVLLARHPGRDWSLDELAERVHASPFHLARSFSAAFDEPIHRYLLRTRLIRALDLVLDTSMTLTTVAAELGFATPSHFTAAFGRAFGATPSALRQQVRPAQARTLRKILTASDDDGL